MPKTINLIDCFIDLHKFTLRSVENFLVTATHISVYAPGSNASRLTDLDVPLTLEKKRIRNRMFVLIK